MGDNKNIIEKDYYTFSEREVKELDWLWKPYIIRGNLNIIVGDGGVGKSFFAAWLLSAISSGGKVPFNYFNFDIGKCILQNAEDDIDATILCRLFANGANTDNIGYFNEENKTFSIQQLDRLEEKLEKLRPAVVILDPIQAYLGDININSSVEVRNALKPLKLLAQKYNCAIIMIMHMNKNTGTNKATNRVMGSYDFIASCRSAILIESNPQNAEEKLFIPIKTNLMKENEKNTLSYKINEYGKIEWLENKGRINADEILSQNNSFIDKSSNAKGFIIGALSRGDLKANELKELVIKKGKISEKNYNVSKASLHKESVINSYQKDKQFYWSLNQTSDE